MKKIVLGLALAGLVLGSCTKEITQDPNTPQDVTFTSLIDNGGLKGLKANAPTVCDNPEADYAMVVIDEVTYYPAVFTVNGVLYTQAVKLTPGDHEVTVFALMDDNGTPEDKTDDVIVRATPNSPTPESPSDFSVFVTRPLPINFSVAPFEKIEVPIEVLCFEEANYEEFGFAWFKPEQITVRQKWFFGDFCTEYFMQYENSLYGPTPKVDMPAIFMIEVYRDDDGDGVYENLMGTYDNEDHYTISEAGNASALPLGVKYVDRTDVRDAYRFRMLLYMEIRLDENMQPVFDYVEKANWYFSDASNVLYLDPSETGESFEAGGDKVYDWVLGFCTGVPADVYVPDPEVPGTGTETAFAFGGDDANCFLNFGFNRWGWSNPVSGDVQMPIYAGAGQCDIEKGTLVGTLTIDYKGDGTATVTYQMNAGYKLEETHLYIGTERFPKIQKGTKFEYTVAPGQYPEIHDLTAASSDTYTVSVPSNGYVIAHAVVSGF